jgi:hypothetical protein
MTNAKLAAWGLGSMACAMLITVPLWLASPLGAQSRGHDPNDDDDRSVESFTIGKGRGAPDSRIQASILLQQTNRSLKELPADEMFYSGERFRLKLRSDRDGYLYVLLRDPQGQSQLIFPSAQDLDETDNRIERNKTQSVPARDFFRFDENAGTERVWVVVSPRPLADLDRAARQGGDLTDAIVRRYAALDAAAAKGIDRARGDDRADDNRDEREPAPRAANTAVLPLRIVHLPR